MKTLKFNHERSELVRSGKMTTTWRVNDEKNLSVDDDVWIIDKVDKKDVNTWEVIGTAKINEVLSKRLSEIEDGELGEHEKFDSKEEMERVFKRYYGNDINSSTPVKIIHFTFTPQKPRPVGSIGELSAMDLTEVKLFADGGSRGNPGPSASGYALLTMDGGVISQGGEYLGITTNNQAEYKALKLGLEDAAKRGCEIVHVYMDSQLVINQIKGTYKIKHPDLIPIYHAIKAIEHHFHTLSYSHVPRELNKLADAMVNEVLDATDLQ